MTMDIQNHGEKVVTNVEVHNDATATSRGTLGRNSKEVAKKNIKQMGSDSSVVETDNISAVRRNVSIMNINMGKQFEKFVEHCDRKELFKVHNPKKILEIWALML